MVIQQKSFVPVVRPTVEFLPSRQFAADLARPEQRRPAAATIEHSRSPVCGTASSRRIRFVEGAVLLSLMAYFGTGLVSAVGIV